MTTSHTPGPWLRDDTSGMKCDVRASNGRKVALCWGLGNGDNYRKEYKAECDANARLIAAAPELLESAKAIAEILRGWPMPGMQREFNALCDSIAKATGSGE